MSTEESLHQISRGRGPLNLSVDECADSLCFVCDNGSKSPYPPEGVVGRCAEVL